MNSHISSLTIIHNFLSRYDKRNISSRCRFLPEHFSSVGLLLKRVPTDKIITSGKKLATACKFQPKWRMFNTLLVSATGGE